MSSRAPALSVVALLLQVSASSAWSTPANIVMLSGSSRSVQNYAFDTTTGTLAFYSSSAIPAGGAGWLAMPPQGGAGAMSRVAYGISGGSGVNGSVRTYTIDALGNVAVFGDPVSSGGVGPAHIVQHSRAAVVFVANYGSGHIAVLPIGRGWQIGAPTQVLFAGANAHEVVLSPDGAFVFVPCLGEDYVAQYSWDAVNVRLVPSVPPYASVTPGAGPRHMAFHPSATTVFVLNELDSTLAVFTYDTRAGTLGSSPSYTSTLPANVSNVGQSAAAVIVAPDGRFVYTTNRGIKYCGVVVFPFNVATGAVGVPVFVAENEPALYWPRFATVSPDPNARYLVVVGERAGGIAIFLRDSTTGALELTTTLTNTSLLGATWGGVFATAVTASGAERVAGDTMASCSWGMIAVATATVVSAMRFAN